MDYQSEQEIPVTELFRAAYVWKTMILAVTIIVFAFMMSMPRTSYEATASVYTEYYSNGSLSPANAAAMALDYSERLKGADARQKVAEKLGLDVGVVNSATINVTASASSRYITISVTAPDEKLPVRIANALAELLEESSYTKKLEGGSTVSNASGSTDTTSSTSGTTSQDTTGQTTGNTIDHTVMESSGVDQTSVQTNADMQTMIPYFTGTTAVGIADPASISINSDIHSATNSTDNTNTTSQTTQSDSSTSIGTTSGETTGSSTQTQLTEGSSMTVTNLTFTNVIPAVADTKHSDKIKTVAIGVVASVCVMTALAVAWWFLRKQLLSAAWMAELAKTPVLGAVGGAWEDVLLRRLGLGRENRKKDEIRRLYYALHCEAKDKRTLALLPCENPGDAAHLTRQLAGEIAREGGKALVLDASDSTQPELSEAELLALAEQATIGQPVYQRVGGGVPLLRQQDCPLARALPTLKNSFDYVLLQAPDYARNVDGLALCAFCEGVIVVAAQNKTSANAYTNCLKALQQNQTAVCGAVLTNYPVRG